MKQFTLDVVVGHLLILAGMAMSVHGTSSRPNIIFILADDVGWR